MNKIELHELLDLSLRRPLTAHEESRLREACRAHGRDADAELAAGAALRHLPDAPVSSNFTARVLRAVEMESRAKARHPRLSWEWLRGVGWARGVAFASVLLTIGTFSYWQYRTAAIEERARSVATVSSVASLPSVELLQDFEAIRRLHLTTVSPAPDEAEKLLAALESD